MTNNTFTGHRKGALLITPGDMRVADNLIRNVSLNITYNLFYNNSGRYALNVGLNPQADRRIQNINITFNRFEHNTMTDPYQHRLNARTGVSAVAIVSSSGIGINQNWFNNPRSKVRKIKIKNELNKDTNCGFIKASNCHSTRELHSENKRII